MKVFVAGATGAIGKQLIPQLVAAGHEVTGMTRSPAKADALRALGAKAAVADGLDRTAVREAVLRAEPEAVIHQMTSLTGTFNLKKFDEFFALTNRLRTEGTDYLLEAAQAAGARRFLAQSHCNDFERTGALVKSEGRPAGPRPAGRAAAPTGRAPSPGGRHPRRGGHPGAGLALRQLLRAWDEPGTGRGDGGAGAQAPAADHRRRQRRAQVQGVVATLSCWSDSR
jgi:NAD(P)H-binding